MKHSLRKAGGFSLVELAVVLAIVGVVGIFIWRWIVATREPMQRPAMLRQLSEAQSAVEGFVLANHRLPCAAATENGNEACADASAVRLPWRALGLGSEFSRLHYGVNRGAALDLAVLPPPAVAPDLNIDLTGMPVLPTYPVKMNYVPVFGASASAIAAADRARAAITAASLRRASVNGLDWCRVVRQFAGNPAVAGVLTAGNVSNSLPVAFVLAHPGENGQFDGNNVPGASPAWRFDLPGRPQDSGYDDLMLAVGPADLAARVGCVARLSEMQATAQGAYAAYDNARVMQEYWSLRVFDVVSAESALQSAEAAEVMAGLGVALATASGVISISLAANSDGVTAFGIGVAAANLAVSIAQLALAVEARKAARAALDASVAKQAAIDTYAAQLYDNFTQVLNAAVKLDGKGLNP